MTTNTNEEWTPNDTEQYHIDREARNWLSCLADGYPVECPFCDKRTAVKKNNTLWSHKNLLHDQCRGSKKTPLEALYEAIERDKELMEANPNLNRNYRVAIAKKKVQGILKG